MQVKGHSQGKKNWHQWKGLVTRNTHVKYESTIYCGSEVMIKVKVFCHSAQRSQSRSSGKKQGPVIWNTHVKYESPICYGWRVIVNRADTKNRHLFLPMTFKCDLNLRATNLDKLKKIALPFFSQQNTIIYLKLCLITNIPIHRC